MAHSSFRHPVARTAARRAVLARLGLWPWALLVRPNPTWAQGRASQHDEDWEDRSRGRRLPVRVRWPAAGSANGAWIVYSHGLGGSREGGDAWGRAWADAGFAVFHLQHPGSDIALWREGIPAVRAAASAEQFLARVGDVRFAIDEVQRRIAARTPGPAGPADTADYSALEAQRIGMGGHSFGARTTLAIAGERFGDAAAPPTDDPRPRAFIAFSPSVGNARFAAAGSGTANAAQRYAPMTRPLLCCTGSLDGDPLSGERSGLPRRAVYDALPTGQRAELWLDGADHHSFGGNVQQRLTARSGMLRREPVALEREAQHQALLARVSGLWWRWRLLGDAQARAALSPPQGLAAVDEWRSG
jgi:hypothetical protein